MRTTWLILILWGSGFPSFADKKFDSLKSCQTAALKIVKNNGENAVCVKGFLP